MYTNHQHTSCLHTHTLSSQTRTLFLYFANDLYCSTYTLSTHEQIVVDGLECEGPNCRGVFDVATEQGTVLFSATAAHRMPDLLEVLALIPRDPDGG